MRRAIQRLVLPAALALAGCATGSTPAAVSLAQVQAEGNAIVAALAAGAGVYTAASTTTPAEAAAVENVLKIAQAENAILQGNLTQETAAQTVETVGEDVTAVLAVLPIDPVTKVAIDAGLAVIDTFIAQSMTTPVAPAAGAALTLRAAPERVAPPVPIPAPHRLPPGAK